MKQKRMFYVYAENLEFYNELENKSQFLNDALQDARLNRRVDPKKPSDTVTTDPRVANTRAQVEAMEARDAEKLRQYRDRQ